MPVLLAKILNIEIYLIANVKKAIMMITEFAHSTLFALKCYLMITQSLETVENVTFHAEFVPKKKAKNVTLTAMETVNKVIWIFPLTVKIVSLHAHLAKPKNPSVTNVFLHARPVKLKTNV